MRTVLFQAGEGKKCFNCNIEDNYQYYFCGSQHKLLCDTCVKQVTSCPRADHTDWFINSYQEVQDA